MPTAATLEVLLKARDEVSDTFGRVGSRAGRLGQTLRGALRTGALLGGAAIIALGGMAIKAGADFDEAYNTIREGTGATGQALEGLKDDFRAIVQEVPQGMGEVAQATADLNTRLGLSGEALQNLGTQALNAARVTGEDSAQLIENFSRSINAMGVPAARATEFMDEMFVVSQNTGVGMSDLAGLVQEFGPVLRNAGLGMSETTALLGELEKGGINVTRVMPALNMFMRNMAKEGVTDLTGALQDQIEQIREASSSSAALKIAQEAFGAEGAQRLVSGIRDGSFALEDLTEGLDGVQGAINETAEESLTLGERFSRLKNRALIAFEPLLTAAFEKVEEAIERLEPWLAERLPGWVAGIQRFIEDARPHVKAFLDAFTLGLETLRPAAEAVFNFILDNKPAIVAAIAAIGVAMVVALGPGAAAVAAIIGFIALVGLIRDNWDEIRAWVEENIPIISLVFDEHFNEIKAVVQFAMEFIRILIVDRLTLIRDAFQLAAALIRGDWSGAWDELKQIVSGRLDSMRQLVDLFFPGLRDAFASGLRLVKNKLLEWLGWPSGLVWSGILTLPGHLFSFGKDMLQGLLDGIVSIKDTILDTVTGIAGEIGEKLNPKNWIGSPRGVQNWFSFYLREGFDNMIATARQQTPRVQEAVRASLGIDAIREAMRGLRTDGPRSALEFFDMRLDRGISPQYALREVFGRGSDFAPLRDQFERRLAGTSGAANGGGGQTIHLYGNVIINGDPREGLAALGLSS